jgi:hypothetical protein
MDARLGIGRGRARVMSVNRINGTLSYMLDHINLIN